jgi:hypothetical protein
MKIGSVGSMKFKLYLNKVRIKNGKNESVWYNQMETIHWFC